MKEPQNETQRRDAVAWAIALTADTLLAHKQYEVDLLEQYARGTMSLDQVLESLEEQVQHLLYRSRALQPLTEDQLTDLLEQARTYNEAHNITGLLCYSSTGHFVQLLEGPAVEVHGLYARILQDQRHHELALLSDRGGTDRFFRDWKMALVETGPEEFFWLMGYLEAKTSNLLRQQMPVSDPLLFKLLEKFSQL
jgi:hypothetical protein